nr:MAG TPA_asm: hypothetical protein [Bacteriophage sp.]
MYTSNLSFPKARVSMEHYSSIFSNFIATRKIWSLPRMLNDSVNISTKVWSFSTFFILALCEFATRVR